MLLLLAPPENEISNMFEGLLIAANVCRYKIVITLQRQGNTRM
jgi:hypothetical protein